MAEDLRASLKQQLAEVQSLKDLEPYFHDIAKFAADAFQQRNANGTTSPVRLWGRQLEVAKAIATSDRVTVKSGHKVGKTRLLAIVAWWWACTRTQGRVILTSTTTRQVRGIIWKEIRALWRMRTGRFEMPEPPKLPSVGVQWHDGREIVGFTADQAEAMAGYSGPEMLFLVDEASGIGNHIFEAIEGNLAGGGHIAMFSNPTQTTGYFYDSHNRERAVWTRFTIKSTETPNYVSGERTIPGLAERHWVEQRIRAWGADSARAMVRIFGEFPDQGDDTIVGRALVEESMERWAPRSKLEPIPRTLYAAIDVSRFGDDESTIGFREDMWIDALIVPKEKLDTAELGERFVEEAERRRNGRRVVVRIDTTGVGGGTADHLRSLKLPWLVVEDVVNASASSDPEKYTNLRAELWFSVPAFLEAGGLLPKDDELDLELGAPKYRLNARNQLVVESKDELRKASRLGRSPDRADCVTMLTWGFEQDEGDALVNDLDDFDDGYRMEGRGF